MTLLWRTLDLTDTTLSPASKHQWRFNRPHRVRLFVDQKHINESFNLSKAELYWDAANKFQKTDQYVWAERNDVKLQFEIDDRAVDWFKQVRFYADLNETEYTDYCLRFFDHNNETWK